MMLSGALAWAVGTIMTRVIDLPRSIVFNVAWQLLFVFGAWCALGGARQSAAVIMHPATLWFCIAYMLLALVMTMAGKFADFGALFPHWLYSTFNPNDKTFLAPYRVIHFVVIAFFMTRFVPKDWSLLQAKWMEPLIKCGQQSLEVFCVGIFLSFVAHFVLMLSWGTVWAQLGVSVVGIALLCCVAYYKDWSKKQDKPAAKAAKPAAQPAPGA